MPPARQVVWNTLPGEFALRTPKGFYVGALSGGGLTVPPTVVTGATNAGDWEKFRIAVMDPPPPNDKSFQTFTRQLSHRRRRRRQDLGRAAHRRDASPRLGAIPHL